MSNTLAIDLGSTNTRFAVGNTKEELKTKVKKVKTDPKNLERQLNSNIEDIREDFNGSIDNISIAATGLLDRKNKIIKKFDTPEFNVIENINLKSLGSSKTRVFIENDANAAALGEQKFGNNSKNGNLIRIVMGTGIGAGIIMNDKPILGNKGGAGEVGRIFVRSEKNDQKIIPGTWGSLCSGRGLVTLAKDYSDDLNVSSSRELFEEYNRGNEEAEKVINKFKLFNLRAIGTLTNTLEPEKIVFGGSLAVNNPKIVTDSLKENLDEHAYVQKPEIGMTHLKGRAELYGALLVPRIHEEMIK